MGCTGSKASFPGFTSSPCIEYTDKRRKACKELIAAHDALLDAATAQAEALKGAGAALSALSATTDVFEKPRSTPGEDTPAPFSSQGPSSSKDAPDFSSSYGGNPPPGAPSSYGGSFLPGAAPAFRSSATPELAPAYAGNLPPPPIRGNFPPRATAPYGGTPAPGVPSSYGAKTGTGVPFAYGAGPVPGTGSAPPYPGPQDPGSLEQGTEKLRAEAEGKKQALEKLARELDGIFLEMSGLLTQPLQEVLPHTKSMSKTAMPPLTAAACKMDDGRFEPIGNSLQKLLIWEQHLKDDTKALENLQHSQHKGDKKLNKRSAQTDKDPTKDLGKVSSVWCTSQTDKDRTKDLGKVRAAQSKVNEAEARIQAARQSIVETVLRIEQFKLEVLYPQAARLFPVLVEVFRTSEAMFQKQKALASEIAALRPVPGSLPDWEGTNFIASTFPNKAGVFGGKAYRDATKGMDSALTKWSSSIEGFAVAQRKYCAALLAWVRTTTYVPADFPKPSGQDLAQLRPGPNGSTDAEASFAGLASDWNKAIDKLPEAPLREALGSMSRAFKAAFDVQKEDKEQKNVDRAKKEVAKAEEKLRAATEKQEECKRASLETRTDPKKAKEHNKREQHLQKATEDVDRARTAMEAAKDKYNAERAAFTSIIHKECDTAGAALQNELPEVFQRCIEYSGAAAQEFQQMQTAYAPWVRMA